MARIQDSRGRYLGGINTIPIPGRDDSLDVSPSSRLGRMPGASLTAKYGPEETIPGLKCSYGSLAYSSPTAPTDTSDTRCQDRLHGCHNPVEAPGDRHHCGACGGDYCGGHADPAAHDCKGVTSAP